MKKIISSVLLIIMTLNIFIFNVSANIEFNEINLPTEDCEFGFIFETDGQKFNDMTPDHFDDIMVAFDELNLYYAVSKDAMINIADKFNILSWEENYQFDIPENPDVNINDIIDDTISLFSTDEDIDLKDENNEETTNENSDSDMSLVNDPWFEWQWYYEAVHAEAYRNNDITGKGVKIGIIDTGFELNLDDFNYDKITMVNAVAALRGVDERIDVVSDGAIQGGHGVPVTSIIAAQSDNNIGIAGITDDVEVIIYDIADPEIIPDYQGNPEGALIGELKACELAYKDGCDVINMSFSGGNINPETYDPNNYMAKHIDKLASKGTIMIAGVGNNGNPLTHGLIPDPDNPGSYIMGTVENKNYNAIEVPAAYTNVIAVGAVEPDIDSDEIWYDSNKTKMGKNFNKSDDLTQGTNTWLLSTIRNNVNIPYKKTIFSTANDSIFISAPGDRIMMYGKNNTFSLANGTSFSSPIVAAAAVGVKQMRPYVNVDMFKEILKATSVDLEEEGYDVKTGWGMVDFKAIYDYVSQMPEAIPEETPVVSVDYINNKLTGFGGGEYSINDKNVVIDNGTTDIGETWYGTSISIVKKASGGYYTDSEPQILDIPAVSDGPNTITTDYNTIIGIDDTMEYKNQTSSEWIAGTNETITGLTAGSYDVRFKATENSFASKTTTVTVENKPKVKEDTPNITIDFDKSILSGFIDGCEYLVDGTRKTSNSGYIALDTAYYGKVITIQKKASDEEHLDSDIQELNVPAIPNAPDFEYEIVFNDEGIVTDVKGITNDMEYRKQGANNWNSGSITSSGKYEIRYKATDSSFASEICLAEFNDQEPTSEYNVETKLNYENSTIRYEYYNFTGADIYATGVVAVYDSNGRFIGMRTITIHNLTNQISAQKSNIKLVHNTT